MKIQSVRANARRKAFEVRAGRKALSFPYAKASPKPSKADPIKEMFVDKDLGREGFTYRLASGAEGTVHIDHVLEYNQDPSTMRDLLAYKLTLEAQRRIETSPLSKRELIRRLETSPAQLYRILDQRNYRKSIDQLLRLLHLLDCDVDLVVKSRAA